MTEPNTLMSKLIKYFLPEGLDDAQETLAKKIIGVSLVQSIAGYIYAPIYYLMDHLTGAATILTTVIFTTLNLFLIKISRNLSFTKHIPALFMFVTVMVLSYTQEGIDSTSLPWFTTIPIIALVGCSMLSAIFWAIMSFTGVLFFYFAPGWGVVLPENPITPENMALLNTVGTAGLVFYLLGFSIYHEISKNDAIRAMYKMANQDMLTGIHSRRKFFTLGKKMFQEEKHLFAVMVDIDNFKAINDQYGHSLGDKVIIQVAKTITELLVDGDVFGRLGGEEFAIMRTSQNKEDVLRQIDAMRQAVEDVGVVLDDKSEVKFTISIGVSSKSDGYTTLDHMLNVADVGLYEAKANGRNQVRFRV